MVKKISQTAVIIPVYNSGGTLRICLESLRKSAYKNFEIIIVNDGSTDNTNIIAEEYGCKIINLNENLGPSAARNIGAASSQSPYIIFLDADTECYEDTLEKLVKPLDNGWDACFGIYTPKPAHSDFFSMYKNLYIYYHHISCGREPKWFWSACGAVRRDAFIQTGGFNEKIKKPSIEDIDFGYKLTKKGYKIYFKKNAFIKHLANYNLINILTNDYLKSREWMFWNYLSKHDSLFINPVSKYRLRFLVIASSILPISFPVLIFVNMEIFYFALYLFLILQLLDMGFFRIMLKYTKPHWIIYTILFKAIDDSAFLLGSLAGLKKVLIEKIK